MGSPKITAQGLTRRGAPRHENQDAFHASSDLGLFVVVDAMETAEAAALAVTALEQTVRAALPAGSPDGVLTAAAERAQRDIKALQGTRQALRGAGAEFAALWIHEGKARIAWSGNCRVYRARGKHVEVVTPTEWQTAPTILGSDAFECHEQVFALEDDETLLLTTDGYHRLADDWSQYGPLEDHAYHVCRTPLRRLAESFMALAEADDDATVLCVRFARIDREAEAPRRVREALDGFCARKPDARLAVRSVQVKFPDTPPGVPVDRLRLRLVLEADPRGGRARAEALAAEFVAELQRACPELGGSHEWTTEPLVIEDAADLARRKERVAAFVNELLGRYNGLYLGSIEVKPAWREQQTLHVLVLRDDVDNADDETDAAERVAGALARFDPALAASVEVRGEYCK
jgi:serine/threonine protein phosphatase PrpC